MIIISPYSSKLRNGSMNPKNYPYWQEVIDKLVGAGHTVVQVGTVGETLFQKTQPFIGMSLSSLKELVDNCTTWASVDNFFPHLCSHTKKYGVVIWSRSDPSLFGYSSNLNLIKDRSYLRPDPFGWWHDCSYSIEAFVEPQEVFNSIVSKCN